MSIETYTSHIFWVYVVSFLILILTGIVRLCIQICKKTLKGWWIIPYCMLYLIFAMFLTLSASMAYDDVADPNYWRYKDWKLHDFILHDIKTFVLWLFIGVLLYFAFERKGCRKSIKMGCTALLVIISVLLVITVILSIVSNIRGAMY